MPFSEVLKSTVRKRAHLRCCICRSFGVDIHHIVPQAEDGSDTEDNAAPLCPSCHETYGANPQKRKLIREARDLWYDLCETRPADHQLREIADSLKNIPTKEDLERLAVRNRSYVLGLSEETLAGSVEHNHYSFVREEFVHPLIVQELIGWLSDSHETVVAVDLTSSNQSNRFFGEFSIRMREGRAWVELASGGGEKFSYAHIGTSPSGVHMVECYAFGDGSGVFGHIGLFSFESDQALGKDCEGKTSTRERVILKSLGSISLGDRYAGQITYDEGHLVVGPDEGWFNRGQDASKRLPVL